MKTAPAAETARWTAAWLDAVAAGTSTMSQRKLTSIEQRGGGLEAVKAAARKKACTCSCSKTTKATNWWRPA